MNDSAKERKQVSTRQVFDVDFGFETDDPTAAVAMFSYIRDLLGRPDFKGEPEVHVTIGFSALSKDQLDTFKALAKAGWGLEGPSVEEIREYVHYSDGLTETRTLSPSGELESSEWHDIDLMPIPTPDSN